MPDTVDTRRAENSWNATIKLFINKSLYLRLTCHLDIRLFFLRNMISKIQKTCADDAWSNQFFVQFWIHKSVYLESLQWFWFVTRMIRPIKNHLNLEFWKFLMVFYATLAICFSAYVSAAFSSKRLFPISFFIIQHFRQCFGFDDKFSIYIIFKIYSSKWCNLWKCRIIPKFFYYNHDEIRWKFQICWENEFMFQVNCDTVEYDNWLQCMHIVAASIMAEIHLKIENTSPYERVYTKIDSSFNDIEYFPSFICLSKSIWISNFESCHL